FAVLSVFSVFAILTVFAAPAVFPVLTVLAVSVGFAFVFFFKATFGTTARGWDTFKTARGHATFGAAQRWPAFAFTLAAHYYFPPIGEDLCYRASGVLNYWRPLGLSGARRKRRRRSVAGARAGEVTDGAAC